MKSKRLMSAVSALILGISSMFVMAPVMVSAAADTCTWTGAGTNLNFSTAANWTGCDNGTVPENGDSLVFDNEAVDFGGWDSDKPFNDLTNAVFDTITFQGGNTDSYEGFEGNAFSLSGGIVSNTSENDNSTIGADITLTANQSFDSVDVQSVNLGTFNLNLEGGYGTIATLAGSGNVTVNSGNWYIVEESTVTGLFVIKDGAILSAGDAKALGAISSGTTVDDGGILEFCFMDLTIAEPLTVAGTGANGYALGFFNGCRSGAGGTPPTNTVTVTGKVTLTADTYVAITANKTVDFKDVTLNGHTLALSDSAAGILKVNGNTSENEGTTTTVEANDKDPNRHVNVGLKETIIVKGERGQIDVSGTLKGTGKVGDVYIYEDGVLAPGLSPGCLTTGNLVLEGTYQVEIAGKTVCDQYDQTKVTGTVNVTGGTLDVSFLNDFLPVAGDSFVIISNDGEDKVTGTFEGIAEGATYTSGEVAFKVSYAGGDGNDVILTVISSPNTGFGILSTKPILTLLSSTLAAGAILVISRRYARAK